LVRTPSVNIAIAAACPARLCSPLRTETENAKCFFGFLHHYYGRKAHFGQTSPSLSTTTGMCGLPKMGAKKAVNLFRLTACMPL